MYKQLFNNKLQFEMEDYFLSKLAPHGIIREYSRNEVIDPEGAAHIYIVLNGSFKQVLFSQEGGEISFFRLERGTIFGEMDYFDGYRTCLITKALESSSVSIVHKDIVEKILEESPKIYRQFIHSITRKYRIVMLELADMRFNDSLGKLAHAILRWEHMNKIKCKDEDGVSNIDMTFTHEELASRLSASRTTVTSCLNFLKDKGYIKIEDKSICVLDSKALSQLVNVYW